MRANPGTRRTGLTRAAQAALAAPPAARLRRARHASGTAGVVLHISTPCTIMRAALRSPVSNQRLLPATCLILSHVSCRSRSRCSFLVSALVFADEESAAQGANSAQTFAASSAHAVQSSAAETAARSCALTNGAMYVLAPICFVCRHQGAGGGTSAGAHRGLPYGRPEPRRGLAAGR